nr:MAK10-like protein [Tanacetum cinerariifolium]
MMWCLYDPTQSDWLTINQFTGGKPRDKNAEESWALIEDFAIYDNESWNNPRDFAKLVKAISLRLDVLNASDRCLIELENQVQCLMEAHLAPKPSIQVNKFASSCVICNGSHDNQYYMENPEQAFVDYASSCMEEAGAILEHTTVETPMNMSPANKAHFESEKVAIHLILTGIGDEIYSTVDAFQTAQEMWEAIERLQQGESSTFKILRQTYFGNSPEWSRFVTIVKQQHKLDKVSYRKLFDILKQYQKEVNELHAERLARNANPLVLVATAQANQDPYYQISKSQKSYAPSSKPSIPTRSHTTTRYKGKEIAKPVTPPSESASEEDSHPE